DNILVKLFISEIVHTEDSFLLKLYYKFNFATEPPSMYHDLKSGRLTEIDFLNGQIADYGSELGVPTPINEMLKHMIHQLENKN
ncbi:hypothetical protein CD150_13150, partial [Staphylococcus ureilyticus]|uniref:ketopantoate reductase family protein n=2 Tax=Staphylococcus ureilyticus TaxID=94138 RepID=UPI000CD3894B